MLKIKHFRHNTFIFSKRKTIMQKPKALRFIAFNLLLINVVIFKCESKATLFMVKAFSKKVCVRLLCARRFGKAHTTHGCLLRWIDSIPHH